MEDIYKADIEDLLKLILQEIVWRIMEEKKKDGWMVTHPLS